MATTKLIRVQPYISVYPYVPNFICVGGDNRLWFTNGSPEETQICAMTLGGTVTAYTVSGISIAGPIHLGSDGNVWALYAGTGFDHIARITPSGVVTTFSLGTSVTNIVLASDGNFYGTHYNSDTLVKITMAGVVTTMSVTGATFGYGICNPEPVHGAYHSGYVVAIDYTGGNAYMVSLSGVLATTYAGSGGTDWQDIQVGADGYYWMADYGSYAMRMEVNPSVPSFTVFTALLTHPYVKVIPTASNVWFITGLDAFGSPLSSDQYTAFVVDYGGNNTVEVLIERAGGGLSYQGGYDACVGPDTMLYLPDPANNVIWGTAAALGGGSWWAAAKRR